MINIHLVFVIILMMLFCGSLQAQKTLTKTGYQHYLK